MITSDSLMPKALIAYLKGSHIETPCYILDIPSLNNHVNSLLNAFNQNLISIAYSYKTNYLKSLVQFLDKRGCYSEVVSSFELDLAENYGVKFKNIIYNGPLKNYKSILKVLISGGTVNIDSLTDLDIVVKVVKENSFNQEPRIGVRLSFAAERLQSRFGLEVSRSNINHVISKLSSIDIEPCMYHFHFPARDISSFEHRIENICQYISLNLPNYKGSIDIGGGIPSPMSEGLRRQIDPNHELLSFSDYGKTLYEITCKYKLDNLHYIIEPGTALAANSLHLVGKVTAHNERERSCLVNTNLSKMLLGGLNSNIFHDYIYIDQTHNKQAQCAHQLNGYTCIETDILSCPCNGDIPEIGTRIIFPNVGSYSVVFKPPFIQPDIPVYLWNNSELKLVRRAQLASDITSLDII